MEIYRGGVVRILSTVLVISLLTWSRNPGSSPIQRRTVLVDTPAQVARCFTSGTSWIARFST